MKYRFFRKLATPVLMFAFISSPLLATDYFVSHNGDDNKDGKSKETAWATISKVNSMVFAPGDKILFEQGITFYGNLILDSNDSGSTVNPLILGSFFAFDGVNARAKNCAKINGGNRNGIQLKGCTGVKIQNIMVTGSGRNTNYQGVGLLVDSCKNIVVDNVEVEGFQTAGLLISRGSSDIKVTNVYAHDNGITGIKVGAGRERVPNKNIYIGYCRTISNQGISDPTKRVRGGISGSGIHLANTEGGIVEYCESADNGGDYYHTAGNGPVGIWMNACKDVTVQYCISHDNKSFRLSDGHMYADGGGFDFDSGCKYCTFQYCYTYNNAGPGFLLCAWQATDANKLENNTVRYCISENDGQQNGGSIWIWHSEAQENMQIYNNIFYNSEGRPCIKSVETKGSFFFRNNIFLVRGTGAFIEGMAPNAVFQGNCYWNFNNSGNWDGETSLEAWRSKGQETLNNKPVGINKDPLLNYVLGEEKLTDPTKIQLLYEYMLQPESPCVDAGLDLSKFNINPGGLDFYGNNLPQGKIYDIGLHEYKKK